MKLEEMSKDERSLLLYFESCATDYGGTLESIRMNDIDRAIADKWHQEGFVHYSRIRFGDLSQFTARKVTHGVFLSEDAWKLAHEERRARWKRGHLKRKWMTTKEQIEIKGIAKVRFGL